MQEPAKIATSAANLRIAYKSSALVAAEVDRVCVLFWRETPSRDTFKAQKAAVDAAVARFGSNVGVICIVEPTAEPPNEEIRKASSKMIADHGTKIAAVALVIEGSGFRAAITRTVLSGIALMMRTPLPVKFFVSPRDAATWIAPHVKQAATPAFAEQVERVRSYFTSSV